MSLVALAGLGKRNPSQMRTYAIMLLQQVGEPWCLEALMSIYRDSDSVVAWGAVLASLRVTGLSMNECIQLAAGMQSSEKTPDEKARNLVGIEERIRSYLVDHHTTG